MFKERTILRFSIAIICIFPVLMLLLLSVSQNWVFPFVLPQKYTAENWMELLRGNSIAISLVVSIAIALLVAFLSTVAGFITSQLIAYHANRKYLLLLAYLPFVLSPVILAVCLKFYFNKMNIAGTFLGVVLAQMIIAFPYCIIFFIGFWNQRIRQYQNLVNTLGGNNYYAFNKIILPIAKPMLLVCFFQSFLISWFEYGLTSVIGYGKVQTLTIKVYQFLTEANLFYAALSCCLLIIPPVVLLWVNKRFVFREE